MGKGERHVKSQKWGKAVVALAKSGPWPFQIHHGYDERKREVPLEGKHLRRYERGADAVMTALDPLAELTALEWAIYALKWLGRVRRLSDRELGRLLRVSPGTVKAVWKRAKGKVGRNG